MLASMPHSRATPAESPADAVRSATFECSPWLAQERVLEEPPARPQEPLRLAVNENLVEQPLDGEAILRVG
jgi:hypothetical protein